ncbi:MAG: DUF1493 family protein [Sphingobacteriales bacterium]|nr:MAG: DUF1493 family protein [Sphingobacteriales bacterium]
MSCAANMGFRQYGRKNMFSAFYFYFALSWVEASVFQISILPKALSRYAPLMEQSSYHIEFKELRKAYREVKAFLEQETAGQISSVKMDIEEDLQIAGDDTYELLEKFITVYRLEASGFDVTQHFLSEGEQFNSGIALIQLISLPIVLFNWLLRLLTFGKFDYTKAVVLPDVNRKTIGLTFGDMVTWYVMGKYSLRKDIRFVLRGA